MQCQACGYVNAGGTERCARCDVPLPASAALTSGAPVVAAVPLAADAPLAPEAALIANAPHTPAAPLARGETQADETPSSVPLPPSTSPSEDNAERAAIQDLRARWWPRPSVTTPTRYAGFTPRLIAFLIDGTILGLFTLPLALAGFAGVKAGLLVAHVPTPIDTEDALTTLLSLGWLAMATIYFTALHTGAGQTIGKALLGIRVRSVRDLAAIGPLRSLVRAFGYVASSSFFGLGFLMVALTPQRRAWHDYLAGTCVVRLAPDEI